MGAATLAEAKKAPAAEGSVVEAAEAVVWAAAPAAVVALAQATTVGRRAVDLLEVMDSLAAASVVVKVKVVAAGGLGMKAVGAKVPATVVAGPEK
eukprot:7295798-Prymnesium_polylepis.1